MTEDAGFFCVKTESKADARGRGDRPGQKVRQEDTIKAPEGGWKTERQRERISAWARTPSGDTTRVP